MNPNIEYEIFTQKVYQKLLNADLGRIKTITVKHNIKLKGRSGQEHQIDVYWEYCIAGVEHKVAIECKNFSKPVPIGRVRDFYGVISDLKNVSGIMVTKVGYQEGAKKYADSYGITLKELRTPREGEGIIGETEIRMHVAVRHRLFLVDEKWAEEQGFDLYSYKQRLDIFSQTSDKGRWENSIYVPLQIKNDKIFDSESHILASIDEIETHIPEQIENGRDYIYKFENAFVETSCGVMKIKELIFEDEEDDQIKIISIDAEEFIMAIINDVQTGEFQQVGYL